LNSSLFSLIINVSIISRFLIALVVGKQPTNRKTNIQFSSTIMKV